MSYIIQNIGLLLGAIPTTMILAVCSMAIGLIFGLVGALIQVHRVPVISTIVKVYLMLIRGIPSLILIYIAFYAIPKFILAYSNAHGLDWSVAGIPNITYAIVALSIERSAYLTEMLRSSILSVDPGQLEACKSIGMTTWQGYRRVIFPQAAVAALPNFGNLFIGAIKGSSLAYVVGVMEITATAMIEATISYKFVELYVAIAVIYWLINAIFEQVFKLTEKNIARYKARN